jgi:hypothetical protein
VNFSAEGATNLPAFERVSELDGRAHSEGARMDGGLRAFMLNTYAAMPDRKTHGVDSNVECAVARGDGGLSAPGCGIAPAAPHREILGLGDNATHERVRGGGVSRAPGLDAATAAPRCTIRGSDSDATHEGARGDGRSIATSARTRQEEGACATKGEDECIALTPPMNADPTMTILTPNAETFPHVMSTHHGDNKIWGVLAKATLDAVHLPGRSTSICAEWV